MTGGSDFHGIPKPTIKIGIGKGNLKIPYELLQKLKDAKQEDKIKTRVLLFKEYPRLISEG